SSMTAGLMNEATTVSTVEDLSNRLEKLGSFVSINSGNDFTTLRIRTLTKNLDETIAIAKEKLLKPKFDDVDFNRDKANALQNIKAAKRNAGATASNVFNLIMYGKDNNFAYPTAGTEASLAAITLDDVKAFYAANYSPKVTTITAVSDLGEAKMKQALSAFADWDGADVENSTTKPFPELAANTLYFIDKPDAPQSEIRIGKRALPYDATGEYYKSRVMNFALGGAFNSRINLNLREDKGYTYGARSFFNGNETRGFYQASAAVRADATKASIEEFMKEMNNYNGSGITAEELNFTQAALGQRDARNYETPRQKLGFLNQMQTYGLAPSFVDKQARILKSLTKAEIDALANKHVKTSDMIVVVVGDKKTQIPELKSLGMTIVELDGDGNPAE
ncbi:MAG: pitrilysin family protein, partial [Litorimonas sp.]